MRKAIAALKKSGPVLAGLVALGLVLTLQLSNLAWLERTRLQVFDAYQTLAPRPQLANDNVVIVDIDEHSIEQFGQWPWPRTSLASLADRLGEAGASVVAFDIVLSEPDRTSPEQIARHYSALGLDGDVTSALADLPAHDALLAQSFADVPVATAFFFADADRGRAIEPKASFSLHGSMPRQHVPSYQGSLQALPEIEQAAKGNGFVSLDGDEDGIVRRVPLVAIYRDVLVPALSLEAIRIAQGAGSPNLLTSDGSGETLAAPGSAVAIRMGGQEIPVTDKGELWVHFPDPDSASDIPAGSILSGEMSAQDLARQFAGRIVFIGSSAEGLQDLVATPRSKAIAGVSVHAAATEQILAGHFLERPDWALGVELLMVLLLAGALAIFLPRLGAAKGALVAGLGIAFVIGASWLAFVRLQYLFDPTYPVVALLVVYIVQTLAVYLREERRRNYIHSAFDRYLSPEIVRQIANDPDKLELGGEERDMSVMMCDIRGFSRISEQYSPREVIDFLIQFLTPMSDILLEKKATIDKYIGDAILAFWNAPLDDPDHHANAARSALAMIEKTRELNAIMPTRDGVVWPGEVKIGIGLNSGLCCVGNMGSQQRLNYSLIGDTVNVAARFEGLTKQYGVPILIGSSLAEKLQGFAMLEADKVRVVGREAPETIHALLGDEELALQSEFIRLAQAHSLMLAAYRAQEWDEACRLLANASASYEDHYIAGLRDLFASRIDQLRKADLPPEWDGVFQATQK